MASSDVDMPKRDAWLAATCAAALAANGYQTWVLNNGIFPFTSMTFPLARELQTAVGIAVGLFVLLAAMRAPRLLRPRPLLVAMVTCYAVGICLTRLATGSPAGVSAGLMLLATGRALPFYLTGVALSLLGNGRLVAGAATTGVLASTLLTTVLPTPGFGASLALDALLSLAFAVLLWPTAAPALEAFSRAPGGEVQALASPRSFLSPSHQVYVLVFIFSAAFGFALSLRIVRFTPVSDWLELALMLAVGIAFAISRERRGSEDALFVAAALLVVSGLLLTPLDEVAEAATANSLLYAGNACFKILMYATMAALCSRNPSGTMMVLACAAVATSAGTFLGADLGHLCNALLAARPEAASAVTGAAVLALFAYALTGLSGFSFSATIGGVAPASPLPEATPAAPSRDELVDAACDALAAERGLTEREREVLGMLARGHNGYHVRDALTLSYNTVKTHVKRIYRKLDVHSQQELIDLVDHRAK